MEFKSRKNVLCFNSGRIVGLTLTVNQRREVFLVIYKLRKVNVCDVWFRVSPVSLSWSSGP